MTVIGNSGFEYTEHDNRPKGAGYGRSKKRTRTVTIKNIKTGDVLFVLSASQTDYRRGESKDVNSQSTRKFLGLDDRYYYMDVMAARTLWGQIQSDGAVLKSDRTILTTIPFFPHYKDPVTVVPSTTPIIIKEPPNIPKVVIIPPAPVKTPISKEDISWIQKIINWIIAILNR